MQIVELAEDREDVMNCENEDCHNYYGMELRENEFSIADFVNWDEEYVINHSETEMTKADNVIPWSNEKLNSTCTLKKGRADVFLD